MLSLDSSIRFYYLHPYNGHITIAYKVNGNSITMGAAFCSPSDSFTKKVGRQIAAGRMAKSPHTLECDGEIRDGDGKILGENVLSILKAEVENGLYQDKKLKFRKNHQGQGENNIPSWMYPV